MKKLVQVQSRLKAPKGNYNSFGKYKYRSLEDILESVKPLLAEFSLVVMLNDEIIQVDDRIYVKATATLIDTETGEKIEVSALAREPQEQKGMSDSQLTGTASSYARKYALNGLFAIDDTKDADTDEYREQSENSFAMPISQEEIKKLLQLASKKGSEITDILKYFNLEDLQSMSKKQYKEATTMLNKKADKNA